MIKDVAECAQIWRPISGSAEIWSIFNWFWRFGAPDWRKLPGASHFTTHLGREAPEDVAWQSIDGQAKEGEELCLVHVQPFEPHFLQAKDILDVLDSNSKCNVE